MKKLYLSFLFAAVTFAAASAQVYNSGNFNFNLRITNGLRINTNLPFTSGTQMPTIVIQGFAYSQNTTTTPPVTYGAPGSISLTLTYYIYGSNPPTNTAFLHYSVSSSGAYTPPISLSVDPLTSNVVIYIADQPYFPRFTVTTFAQGLPAETSANCTGWTVTDDVIPTSSSTVSVPYNNTFGGNVSIGTTTGTMPTAFLNIGSASSRGEVSIIGDNVSGQTNAPILTLSDSRTNGRAYSIYSGISAVGNFDILDQNATVAPVRLTIDPNGNVYIGPPIVGFTGNYKLDVNGFVRANEVVVNTTGADFVFDPSYRLNSLSDLKKYIDQNHHLPEIASAKQMQADGIKVGENEVKLLQKVEELTLYMIEADKKEKEQQTELDTQKKKNKDLEDRLAKLETQMQLLINGK